MKVYIEPGFQSYGINRVAVQLAKYAPPGVEIVADPAAAELTVMHIIGRHDHNTRRAAEIVDSGRKYAVIQYVLQSSRNPDPRDWFDLWLGAKVTWSYYRLPISDYYHAPLAADPEVFYPMPIEKSWLIGSNGNNYAAECIGEVQLAAYRAQRRAVHIGPQMTTDPHVDYFTDVPDAQLRNIYNRCDWFAALRRKDGFELIAVEALLCGTRPILFDTPNYRQWFDGLGVFIPETAPAEVVGNLKHIFKGGVKPVTEAEREETLRRFNWQKIITGFWDRCTS